MKENKHRKAHKSWRYCSVNSLWTDLSSLKSRHWRTQQPPRLPLVLRPSLTTQGTTALAIFTINQLCLSLNLYKRDENLDWWSPRPIDFTCCKLCKIYYKLHSFRLVCRIPLWECTLTDTLTYTLSDTQSFKKLKRWCFCAG